MSNSYCYRNIEWRAYLDLNLEERATAKIDFHIFGQIVANLVR
jgi:hypothetical protein